jgi:hypothetical protein
MRHALRAPVVLLLLLLPVLSSCSTLGLGGAAQPPVFEQLVDASDAAEGVLAPRMRAYLAADPTLSLLEKDQLAKLLTDWRLAIDNARQYLGTSPAPAPLPPDGSSSGTTAALRPSRITVEGDR